MIEQISKDVSNKLFTTTGDFADFSHFGGIDAHLERLNSMLCLASEKVRMVGIVGPSGIGKSTIARALFSRLCNRFDHRAFECEYKRTHRDDYGTQLGWEEQFMSKLLDQKDLKINHLGAVKERLKHKKVLIVLDNVDVIVLETLLRESRWFGFGSRIIVVTQDKAVLKSNDIDLIYDVQLPSTEVALEMFSRSAFRQNSPPNGFIELAVEVVSLSDRLPLGLSVLGSSLRRKDKEEWVELMPMLRKDLNGEIKRTLRVGYDALDNKDNQELFLWIACLYNGASVNYIKYVLGGVFTSLNSRLIILADKSLIRTTGETVQMHILLQKLGKEIGKGRFLVDSKEISDMFIDDTGTNNIQAICWNTSGITDPLSLNKKSFKRMPNLRVLEFYKVQCPWWQETCGNKLNLPKGLVYLPRKLTLLRWDEYPAKYIPLEFKGEHLVELSMKGSKLEKLWEGTQQLQSLKKMNLGDSEYLKEIPDLSNAINLEKLVLKKCTSLVTLPSTIRNLKKLTALGMYGCSKLEGLPTDVNLESLTNLDLDYCSRLRSFPQITQCISKLNLADTAIDEEESSLWIENISWLKSINWTNCLLRCVPSNFDTKHLRWLYMRDGKFEKFWEGVKSLGNLHTMDLWGCQNLREIPDLSKATNLVELNLAYCESLVMLPADSIRNLRRLKKLDMRSCTTLEVLPTDVNLESLKSLNLRGCSRLRSFPQISKSIKELDLDCTAIEEVPSWIENMSKLKQLNMSDCKRLKNISPSIFKLRHLAVANFSDCVGLESFGKQLRLKQ